MPQAVPFRPMELPPLAGAPLHRRSLLIGIAAGMLAAGAAVILLTDAWRHEDPRQFIAQTEPVPARPVPERAWPGARLNTGAAATWPGSGAVAPEVLALAMPPLDLAEVGPTLSPEWQLVLAPPPVAPPVPATLRRWPRRLPPSRLRVCRPHRRRQPAIRIFPCASIVWRARGRPCRSSWRPAMPRASFPGIRAGYKCASPIWARRRSARCRARKCCLDRRCYNQWLYFRVLGSVRR